MYTRATDQLTTAYSALLRAVREVGLNLRSSASSLSLLRSSRLTSSLASPRVISQIAELDTAGTRREQAELEQALALSSTQAAIAHQPAPPTAYPSLHGTLPITSSVNRTSSDERINSAAVESAGSSVASRLKGPFTLVPNTLSTTTDEISSFSATRRAPVAVVTGNESSTIEDSFGSSLQRHIHQQPVIGMQQAETDQEQLINGVVDDYVLGDSEDERQASGHAEVLPTSSVVISGAATVDPALVFPPLPLSDSPSGLTIKNETAESSIGGSTAIGIVGEQACSTADAPAPAPKPRKVPSVGKKDAASVFLGVEVPALKRKPSKSKKASEVAYKSAETVDDSDEDEVVSRKKVPSPRRGRTRSASVASHGTDYDDEPPHVKTTSRKKQRRVADSPDPVVQGTSTTISTKRSRSHSITSSTSGASKRKRHLSPAISEDGAYDETLALDVARAQAKESEVDSDFESGKKKRKGKGKAMKEKGGKEAKAPKEKKERAPRKKKKDAEDVQPDDFTTAPNEETSTASTRAEPAPVAGEFARSTTPPGSPSAPHKSIVTTTVVVAIEETAVPAAAPAPKARKKVARLVVESDEEEAEVAIVAPIEPAEKSKNRSRQATDSAKSKKGKLKVRVVESEDEDEFRADGEDDSVAQEVPEAAEDDDEEEDRSPVRKQRSRGKGKEKKSSPLVARPPVTARGRRPSEALARMDAVMRAATEEVDTSFLAPVPRKDAAPSQATTADKSDSESVKENDVPATKPAPAAGTPVAAAVPKRLVAPARAGTPGSSKSTPKARGLAGVLQKTGLFGYRAPGLSSRQKIPSLHKNLQPPPPPKAAIPKEKDRKKKKEVYSDEELPWYETKDPEEWDDEDHYKYQKMLRRKEQGLDSD